MKQTSAFGTESIGFLLRQQAIPASIGILVMSLNMIVDTVFVGRWIGSLAIGAVTIVMPITFLISSLGMSIGIGGSSLVSRALGSDNQDKADLTYGNKISLTVILSLLFVFIGILFQKNILSLFGGKGDILPYAQAYFQIVLIGTPFLAWAMMANPLIRALGFPKYAMVTMIVPAILNVILDPLLIIYFDMGIEGAAWATSLSYLACALYTMYFLIFKNNELEFKFSNLIPKWHIVQEISSIGSVSLARQGVISILAIVLHNLLFQYGGEIAIAMYGIASRFMMFALFPVLGITQGFLPVAGYNYGAQLWDRVHESISLSIKYATIIAGVIFLMIMIFTAQVISIFTTDQELIMQTVPVIRWIFLATPLIAINLIGSGYFQAIGKSLPALFLTLTKQGIFLIPLILILPHFFGLSGIWYSFPIADIGAAIITYFYLKKEERLMGVHMSSVSANL
jgi:putative MATE family efflux protein